MEIEDKGCLIVLCRLLFLIYCKVLKDANTYFDQSMMSITRYIKTQMVKLVRFEWVAMTAGEDVFCRQADMCVLVSAYFVY